MESDEVVEYSYSNSNSKQLPIPSPLITFCRKLISLQAEIVYNCILNLASPFFSIISLATDLLFYRTPPRDDHETANYKEQEEEEEEEEEDSMLLVPADTDREAARGGTGSSLLLGRIGMGLLAAAYVCVVLIVVMVVAAVLGVGLVRMWVEEPIHVKESLQFDYADAHPTAVFSFGCVSSGVPVGQTLYVSLVLLMPESDYNRDVGIFQLTAELISGGGDSVVAKSSHPCMLRFTSWPVRLVRTFMMGVPLLLGITTETQKLTFPILKHREVEYPRTGAIRITLIPRAGTLYLPQFYDAEILVKSRLPWMKELVYRWKWTFCVWTTLYIFTVLVMALVFFLKPLIFPVLGTPPSSSSKYERDSLVSSQEERTSRAAEGEEKEGSEKFRRWQQSRSKRKAALLHHLHHGESVGDAGGGSSSAASSITVAGGGEIAPSLQEGSGDSESVCFGGFDGG